MTPPKRPPAGTDNSAPAVIGDTNAVAALNAKARSLDWPLRCDRTLSFERPELGALCELWHAKARGRGLPSRSVFDMRALKPFLGNISLLECVAGKLGRRYRFRLFGSTLVRIFGERTGQFLDEYVPAEFLPLWVAAYDTVFAYGGALRFLSQYRVPSLDYLKGESFSAPVLDEAGRYTLILSATYTAPKDGELPHFD